MGNLRRRLMLVSLIMLCVMPQGFIQAAPLQTDVNVDLSWLKELPPMMVLVIIMFLVLTFTLRYLNGQQKVSVQAADGSSKHVHPNEFNAIMLRQVLDFMQESKAKDRVFMEGITEGYRTAGAASVQALEALKTALVEGTGNQITAMMEVRDEFRSGVQQMQNHRGELTNGLTVLNSRVGSTQAEGARMNKTIEELVSETRKMAVLVRDVVDRLAKVETLTGVNTKSTQAVKDDVDELRTLMEHFSILMHDLTEAVLQAEKNTAASAALLNPPGPVAPETKEDISDGKPST